MISNTEYIFIDSEKETKTCEALVRRGLVGLSWLSTFSRLGEDIYIRLDLPGLDCGNERGFEKKNRQKTYNSEDSLVVTHPTTNSPACGLSTAERTGSPVFHTLWSYVLVNTSE
ncbi:uncharacterized protein N7479_008269 [Penicillium vulpinum]|uniref:uncharacterized protein n=1 Tax=Penicillium vulpinum TaxID=29845 RepID=UPI00254931D6|nr:uncharacterized protein N7479_008269 [Penicillium vulpinum]KAJ5961119.1 hypothetical protein N7479_008269 [Penicillium vulpinum]